MRSRRVPVLKLGSRGPGGDARSLRLCSQSVHKRPQAFASVRKRPQALAEGRTCRRVQNRRETQNCRHFSRFVLQKCQQSEGSGGPGRETQNCRHFWTRLASSRRKSVNSPNCRHFWTRLGSSRLKSVNSQGSGGSGSRNPELSSLLDSPRVFASQKCQQSPGSGGAWWRNPELSSLLDSSGVFASQKSQQSQGSGGRGRET